MLGKLFKSKQAPQNNGEFITQDHIANLRISKIFELELTNMEGQPCYRLQKSLSFGSEIGDVLIADDSISPRHCTFTLEQDVISLTDHKSVNGTKVNDVAIEPGKSLILDESDLIKIGELLISIKTHNEAVVRERKSALTSIPDEVDNLTLEDKTDSSIELSGSLMNEIGELSDKFKLDDKLESHENTIHLESLLQKSKTMERLLEDHNNEEELLELVEEDDQDDSDIDAILDEQDFRKKSTPIEKKVKTEAKKAGFTFFDKKKPKDSFRTRAKGSTYQTKYAANTVLRIVALQIDLLLSYGVVLLISPFDDFKNLVSQTETEGLAILAQIAASPLYVESEQNLLPIIELVKDVWKFTQEFFNPIPTLVIFAISKLVFTLILGVSLGQGLVKMKSSGNIIWKRIGGVLRTLIGFITFPFIIFDIGAVISRRTFKEVVTFTHLYSDSKIMNILLSLIFLPLSVFFVLMAPMFQGFESSPHYQMPKEIVQRIHAQENDNETSEVTSSFSSGLLGFKVDFDNGFIGIPGFKFEGSGSKTNSTFVLNIYDKKMKGSSQIENYKNFDLRQLLEIGLKGNPFLKLKYPHLDNFINQHTPAGFKRSSVDNVSFSEEFMSFHRMAMDMSLESYFNYAHEVPLVTSLLHYKESFIALLEGADLSDMNFVKMGNITALRIGQKSPKPHDFIIPIMPEGKILKVSFSGEKVAGQSLRIYKYSLDKAQWGKEVENQSWDKLISSLKEGQSVAIEDAQSLYEDFYKLSAKVLSDNDPDEYTILTKAVKSVGLLLESFAGNKDEAISKLEANFKDLIDAVEIKNLEYFNISQTKVL